MIEKNFWKFEDEGRDFAKSLRSQQQFIQTWKGQNFFGKRMLFLLVPGVFLYVSKKLEKL